MVEAELAYSQAAADGGDFESTSKYGLFLWRMGRHEQARSHLERALSLALQAEATPVEGTQVAHQDIVRILLLLAKHYAAQEKYTEAQSLYLSLVNRLRDAHELETDAGAGALERLAETHIKKKDYESAEPLLRKAMDIRSKLT